MFKAKNEKIKKVTMKKARKLKLIEENYNLENGFYHSGDVIKCINCKSKVCHSDIYKEEIWGTLTEVEYKYTCTNCKKDLGYFAYGDYDYYFIKETFIQHCKNIIGIIKYKIKKNKDKDNYFDF